MLGKNVKIEIFGTLVENSLYSGFITGRSYTDPRSVYVLTNSGSLSGVTDCTIIAIASSQNRSQTRLIAAPLTGLICWWLSKFMISRFGYFTVSFPWLEAAGLIVFIVAAVLLMTFICLRRENKIDIIDEIKRESV